MKQFVVSLALAVVLLLAPMSAHLHKHCAILITCHPVTGCVITQFCPHGHHL